MPIQQGQCTIFKKNCLSGLEDFAVGTSYVYKMALYTANANLGPDTLTYGTDNEVVGTGYSAGGLVLQNPVVGSNGSVAYISFDNAVWTPASFTARGALIYNSTTGAAVAVLDFGSDKTATGTFTVTFPTATAASAIIRFA